MPYYNTTLEDYPDAKVYKKKNDKQEHLILEFFQESHTEEFTPFEVLHHAPLKKNTPITSVRRAINDLTKRGELVKTGNKKMGDLGKMNFTWRFNIYK